MGLFSKKETLIQNMTFMGIFSAINVVISLLSTILFAVATPISILLIIILPLTSTVVELFCKDKYYPIYLFSTIGLSLVVTMWDMQNTIFYLIPSVFTGYIFGLLTKKRISGIYSIIISASIHTLLTYSFLPLLNLIYDVNFIDTLKALLGFASIEKIDYIIPSLIFFISLIQIFLSFIIVNDEIKKIYPINESIVVNEFVLVICSLITIILSIVFVFIYLPISFLLLIISLYFTIGDMYFGFKKSIKMTLINLCASIVLFIVLFAVFYTRITEPYNFMLLGIFMLINNIISIVVSFLIKKYSTIKIKKQG